MVLFLFINVGIICLERIIFLYNSKSKKSKLTLNKNPIDEEEESENDIKLEEQEKEEEKGERSNNKYSENIISFNNLEISPIKNQISSSKKRISLDGSMQEEVKKVKVQNNNKKENIYKNPIFFKCLLHVVLLILFCYFILILMPTGTGNEFQKKCIQVDQKVSCFLSETNNYLIGFYFLYALYFLCSSLQIK